MQSGKPVPHPGEGERFNPLDHAHRSVEVSAHGNILPLPLGEGRGEGSDLLDYILHRYG